MASWPRARASSPRGKAACRRAISRSEMRSTFCAQSGAQRRAKRKIRKPPVRLGPKSEALNNLINPNPANDVRVFRFWFLFIGVCFGIRYSNFGFLGVKGQEG